MWQCLCQIQVTNLKTSSSGLMVNIETNASCLAFSIVLRYCSGSLWRHLVGKFATNAIGAIWWLNLEPMQVAPSGGQLPQKFSFFSTLDG